MKRPRVATLPTMLLIPLSLFAQEAIRDPLLRWMNQSAQRQLQARQRVIDQIHTVEEAERRKQKVRETLLELLGGLPDYSGPLHPQMTGKIQAEGYTIEKVLFQSLPDFYVTADLYRPNPPGRYPAILFQSGHTQEGKPEPQRAAANLALKGFVVLAPDPIGQGEREQSYDPQLSGALGGWSVPEHVQAGAQSLLVGESVGRFFIWDAKRGLDYLASRPDVDPSRLGAAGCSGGGALTTFIAALDPRVKAVVPACYPNSYQLLFAGPDPDTEMTFPEFLAHGLDVADFVEVTSPTPWLIQATEQDYFTPAGTRLVYEEARHWYGIYGAENKIAFFVGPGPHGTPLVSREALYQWMIRWLKDGQGDFHEQPVHLYNNFELRVTPTGHVDDIPGSRKVYQLILDDFHTKKRQGSIAELQAELGRLKIPSDGTSPAMTVLDESNTPDFRRQHIKFESEPGIEIEGNLYVPFSPSGRKPAVLLLADNGPYFQAATTDSLAKRMAKKGRVVLTLEPRDSPGEETHAPFVGNWITNFRANQIGLNLPAMRAHDIVRGVDLLSARSDVDAASIRGAARGVKGVWLLLAAAADPRIGKVWLDRSPYSLRAALENTLNMDLFDAVIPGFALHWDFDDLTQAMGNRPVMWTDPANWMNRIVSLPGPYQYRYILGDTTELADAQDNAFIEQFLQ
ncbi:MAG TPA: acetylxylan esterase [Terriglobia bacterium]|nr:acetylxylan esterase [Terriglobia bacterium]